MSGPDERLRHALRGLPDPDEGAQARARRRALGAMAVPASRRRRALVPAAAATAAAALVAGVALGASGQLQVRLGKEEAPAAPARTHAELALPEGAWGMAVLARGRLWLHTRDGLGVSGLAASAAELSPRARYVAVGIGTALVAMAPDGRHAWSHEAGGPVVAAAWAPNPILIAYVVRRGARHELRLIEGDGDGDRLLDTDVAPVRPSWAPDTLALAYAGADGGVRLRDRRRDVTRVLEAPRAGPVTALAYAPGGARIALARSGPVPEVVLLDGEGRVGAIRLGRGRVPAGLAWAGPGDLLLAERPVDEAAGGALPRVLRLRPAADGLAPVAAGVLPGLIGLGAAPGGPVVAVVANAAGGRRLWRVDPPAGPGTAPLAPSQPLLRLPLGAGGRVEVSLR